MTSNIQSVNTFSEIINQEISSVKQAKQIVNTIKDFDNVKKEAVNKAIDYLVERWRIAHIELLEGKKESAEKLYIELEGLNAQAFSKVANMWVNDPQADKEIFKDGIVKFNKLFTSYDDVLLNVKRWQPRKNVFEKLGKEKYIDYLKSMVSGLKKPKINKTDIELLAQCQSTITKNIEKSLTVRNSQADREALANWLIQKAKELTA